MEQATLLLIVITNVFLVLILGVLAFLIYKLFRQKLPPVSEREEETKYHPAALERLKGLEKLKPKRSDVFCANHPEEPGEVTCAICDKLFCKACIKPYKAMYLCKEHMPLVMRHEWEEVLTIKTSTTDPERGVRLYDAKKALFLNENLPTYIETHYKINVDQDYIETYLVLFGIKEQLDTLKSKLNT